MHLSFLTVALGVARFVVAGPVSTTESDPTKATGTPGRIPDGNPPEPDNPYPNTGELTQCPRKPFMPAGGVNVNKTDIPVYQAFSDFDWQSLALALHQEWIELDLFQEGLKRFGDSDFEAQGLTKDDRDLIAFMAEQEIGHAALITNILGPQAPKQCAYQYPFKTVPEFVDFCQKLTRWGESGVYGFLPHMDSRPAAQLLLQSITTEARQQQTFRQFEGLFPFPVWFEVGVPQSFAWTLLAPYITSCPPENHKLAWQNFPALYVTNNPQAYNSSYKAAITHTRPRISYPGREVTFKWEKPGKHIGPNNTYITTKNGGDPKFAAWISQLNTTYTPLYDVNNDDNTGKAKQPEGSLFSELNPMLNGTSFVVLTDTDLYVTPHNLSLILDYVVAGPTLYQAG